MHPSRAWWWLSQTINLLRWMPVNVEMSLGVGSSEIKHATQIIWNHKSSICEWPKNGKLFWDTHSPPQKNNLQSRGDGLGYVGVGDVWWEWNWNIKRNKSCLLWHACNVQCGEVRCEGYVMGMIFDVSDVGAIEMLCEMSVVWVKRNLKLNWVMEVEYDVGCRWCKNMVKLFVTSWIP